MYTVVYAVQSAFIHLFIQAISIAPLPFNYYSEALPTQHGYCVVVSRRSALHRKLRVKDLPKVPTCRLERESTLRTKADESTNEPPRHALRSSKSQQNWFHLCTDDRVYHLINAAVKIRHTNS